MKTAAHIALLVAMLLTAGGGMQAQDVTPYTLRSGEEDIFQREVNAALARAPMDERLPQLSCTVEYLRRLDGDEIVYRRGPIDMHQHGGMGNIAATSSAVTSSAVGTRPISPDDASSSFFTGGILVDLPRAGESGEPQILLPAQYRYMLRVALIPQRYVDGTLTAVVYLERAVVREDGEELELFRSEVFSRTVELDGNLPLKFDLPSWDSSLPGGGEAVPERLREGVLLTLETP
ncbi:MAG: hypothetical protein RRA94_12390, partial [Bacteroidota bacterium]|nr:hypothetical protein [Bacteroidota bacterium]